MTLVGIIIMNKNENPRGGRWHTDINGLPYKDTTNAGRGKWSLNLNDVSRGY